jgi:hypothetical protein
MTASVQGHISLPKTLASGDASEWFQRFDICSKANGWNEEKKATKLPTLLEGEALAVWLEMSQEDKKSYDTAKKIIMEKLMPAGFLSLEEFYKRKLHPGEPLQMFIHELKTLLNRAMPDMDVATRDQLLLHQFLAGIPLGVSKQLRASGDTTTVENTLKRAKLLMAIHSEEPIAAVERTKPSELDNLRSQLEELTGQVAALTMRRSQRKISWKHIAEALLQL